MTPVGKRPRDPDGADRVEPVGVLHDLASERGHRRGYAGPLERQLADDRRDFGDHPWFLKDDARGGTDPWLEVFIDYWNRPGSYAALPAPMKAFLLGVGWKMFQEVRTCFTAFESFEQPELRGIHATVAMGSRSPRASRAMAQALARANPGLRLAEVQGTGHMAPITHAPLLHAAMRAHAAAVSP